MPHILPPPNELALRDEGVKDTIALSKQSVEFFKSHAARNQTQYQRMIGQLLDAYVDAHAQPPTGRSAGKSRKRPPVDPRSFGLPNRHRPSFLLLYCFSRNLSRMRSRSRLFAAPVVWGTIMAYAKFLQMEKAYVSGSCHVRSHFIRQVDGKYPVNGIAISS